MREEIIKSIREFFYRQNFHEVITPILNKAIPNEPNLYPFRVGNYFLPMSPERSLKLALAKGVGNCFAISPSFRNLEQSGSLHSPEFLMLEWYRIDANYRRIMDDVKELFASINFQFSIFNFQKSWPIFPLPELFKKYTQYDLIELTNDESKRADYDKIFCNEIEPHLPKSPCFITDFPSSISPLCKPKKNNPLLADRFEFYINGIELGNGNTENTDYRSVRKVFEEQKKKNGFPVDEEFLDALRIMNETGKTYAGIGVGIDRLTMLFCSENSVIRCP